MDARYRLCYHWGMSKKLRGKTRISLAMAAELFGYRSTSTLRRAAIRGTLAAEKNLTGDWETTAEEVSAYKQAAGGNYRRGQPRKDQDAGALARE